MIAHIIAIGKVQGVGFRFTIQQKAISLGITGWVKNLADGTVEIVAEGTKDELNILINSMKKGLNPFIKIDDLRVEITDDSKGFKKFKVLY
ncbi:acylphosphatase [Bacillus sp. FJAT-49736]|uniref:acylphosphatase n=1 Tax=Bacillus sp. FJAT-49736 TaxID=2833582 RepID=UPI001BCA1BC6|nr:acylphosphatase [Bacillus sp. FJAT-49736]MBS4175283.1 acylphosphatase [Bacillus sp. FJAT-49736]